MAIGDTNLTFCFVFISFDTRTAEQRDQFSRRDCNHWRNIKSKYGIVYLDDRKKQVDCMRALCTAFEKNKLENEEIYANWLRLCAAYVTVWTDFQIACTVSCCERMKWNECTYMCCPAVTRDVAVNIYFRCGEFQRFECQWDYVRVLE